MLRINLLHMGLLEIEDFFNGFIRTIGIIKNSEKTI